MRRPTRLVLAGIFCLAAGAPPASGEAAPRPRVGLVLSGGGARGLAHVGVLSALERLRIPIDAIAGTSMGAMVGGLYAAGVEPEEIEKALGGVDWSDSFKDSISRERLAFRRKEDDRGLLFNFQVGVRDGHLRLPHGLIQGQKLNLLLRALTLPAATVRDFDTLPIPFRAVASDLGTGEAVVLSSGDLVQAIRASMAFPGVFSPVEIDSRVLVDGAIADNLPVDVARAMGVDVLIAVDTGEPLDKPETLDTPVGITNQMLTLMIRRTTEASKKELGPQDVLLVPDASIGSAQFDRIAEVIAGGRQAVEASAAALAPLAVAPDAYAAFEKRRRGERSAPPRIDEIRVETGGRIAPEVVAARLETRPRRPLSIAKLRADLDRVYGLGLFDEVGFELSREAGKTVLDVTAEPKSWGPNYLRFGLNLRDDFRGEAGFDIGLRYTATAIDRLGAEWRNDLRLGENQLFATELYQPLRPGGMFVAPRVSLSRRNLRLSVDGSVIGEFRLTSAVAGVDVGWEVSDWGEVRFGLERERLHAAPRVGAPDLRAVTVEEARLFARLAADRLDDASFPRHGFSGAVEVDRSFPELGADDTSSVTSLRTFLVGTHGRTSLAGGVDFGYTFEEGRPFPPFSLGGLFSLSGYRPDEFLGDHIASARLLVYRQTAAFGERLYLGASLEGGKAWSNRNDVGTGPVRWSGSLFGGAKSVLGPLYLAAGLGERGRTNYYFFLGRTF
ncbi:MAG TPA: patatin-like phospholipase family protein [Thermoanaerobaculia bacterium]|nr:patatin-like phospholipase family protein [Thermoanaerobaculia bacterium]